MLVSQSETRTDDKFTFEAIINALDGRHPSCSQTFKLEAVWRGGGKSRAEMFETNKHSPLECGF